MSAYLDASALVPLFIEDVFSARIDTFMRNASAAFVSDFAAAELVSAFGVRIRIGQVTQTEARAALSDFDDWKLRNTEPVNTISLDVSFADSMLRRFDLVLRTPDALHIAMATRLGAELVTFDERMALSAKVLGVPVAAI